MFCRPICLYLVALTISGRAVAQLPEPDPIRLTIHPAAEPVPALKYPLLPTVLDIKPGNAAPLYLKLLPYNERWEGPLQGQIAKATDWLSMPVDKLPRDEVRSVLDGAFSHAMEQVAIASRRSECDWELPIRDQNPIVILLPELQGMRNLARILALKTRLEIAEGRFDDAAHSLQTGFAMSRHAAEGPTLVNALVGVAMAGIMLDQMETLMQQPGAPNMYWALTSLPSPLIDIRDALQFERHWLEIWIPELRDLETAERTSSAWQKLLERIAREISTIDAGTNANDWQLQVGLVAMGAKAYPDAKRHLLATGKTSEEVEAMPVAQVLLILARDTYLQMRDEMFKWSYVPVGMAGDGPKRADELLKSPARFETIVPRLFLPALGPATVAPVKLERRIAMLRIVEALRLYAAANDGKLPATLADIKQVPIPLDPMTNQPCSYSLDGATARLGAQTVGLESPQLESAIYLITVSR